MTYPNLEDVDDEPSRLSLAIVANIVYLDFHSLRSRYIPLTSLSLAGHLRRTKDAHGLHIGNFKFEVKNE